MLHGQSDFFHGLTEFRFVLFIGMHFDGIAPRVYVPAFAAVVLQIPGGTQEDARGVHQLAERKISGQNADEEQMDIEWQPDGRRNDGAKTDYAKNQFLYFL